MRRAVSAREQRRGLAVGLGPREGVLDLGLPAAGRTRDHVHPVRSQVNRDELGHVFSDFDLDFDCDSG